MAEAITQVLGIVGIKNRGEYNPETTYEKLNTVRYQGATYCAKTDTQGNLPTDTDYWDLMVEKGEKGDKPVRGVDYYTAEDKAEIEADLASDVTSEVTNQLGDLTSATPLAASSVSEMTDTTRIYVNTTDGHWYWYNGTNWIDGGVYQATQDAETMDIRTAYDGTVYDTAGNSVRTQVGDLVDKIDFYNDTGLFTIPLSKWEPGYWLGTGYDKRNNSTRMSLKDPITFDRDVTIKCDTDDTFGRYQVTYYIIENGEIIYDSHYKYEVTIPANSEVLISARLSPEVAILNVMTRKEFVSHYRFSTYLSDSVEELGERITDIETEINNIPADNNFSFDYAPIVDGIGHRGIAGYAPQNTLASFKKAKKLGFRSVETDIRWTSDGIPVLCHNSSINSTARNMDGTEIQGTIYVHTHTLEELRQYDYGISFSEEYRGETIPTLEDFLVLCRNIGLSPQLEIKQANNVTAANLNTLFNLIDSYGWKEGIRWSSFVPEYLQSILDRYPKTTVQYMPNTDVTFESARETLSSLKNDYKYANVTYATTLNRIDAEIILWLKTANIPLLIYTVDDITTIQNMDKYISGVISNTLNAEKVIYDYNMADVE